MNAKLPERASLEYLKKLAKDRLQDLRLSDPEVKLATTLLAVAQEHGFSSWWALKAEIEQRQTNGVVRFFDACIKGDLEAVRDCWRARRGIIFSRRYLSETWT